MLRKVSPGDETQSPTLKVLLPDPFDQSEMYQDFLKLRKRFSTIKVEASCKISQKLK